MKKWKKEFKMEIDTIKKTIKETIIEVGILKNKSGVTNESISNRLQEMEKRISEAEDNIENIDKTVREDEKSKKLQSKKWAGDPGHDEKTKPKDKRNRKG